MGQIWIKSENRTIRFWGSNCGMKIFLVASMKSEFSNELHIIADPIHRVWQSHLNEEWLYVNR